MMIDTHHHFVLDVYAKGNWVTTAAFRYLKRAVADNTLSTCLAVEKAGGDPSGYHVPEWSVEASEASLARNNATTAILSVTSPGTPIAKSNEESRSLARQTNEFCAKLRDEKPSQFGFFAAMPNLLDTEGSLAEIKYALDTLHADGVTLFTRYGNTNCYLGHEEFEPVWAELDARAAVVFIHPTHPVDTNRVNPLLKQPTIDYPHETTRTAMDLLLSRNRRRFPRCKVILPHAGGTLPWTLPRTSLWRRGLAETPDGITYEDIMTDFRSFYFDLALSTSHAGLDLLVKTVPHEHILYGQFPSSSSQLYAHIPGLSRKRSAANHSVKKAPISPTHRRQACPTSAQT